MQTLVQPFDPSQFNFNKVQEKEVCDTYSVGYQNMFFVLQIPRMNILHTMHLICMCMQKLKLKKKTKNSFLIRKEV